MANVTSYLEQRVAAANSDLKRLESYELNWEPKYAVALKAWTIKANNFLRDVRGMEIPDARSVHIAMEAKACEIESIMPEYDTITRQLVGSRGQTRCNLDTAFMIHAQR